MKFNNWYDYFILFIITVKILFLVLRLLCKYYQVTQPTNTQKIDNLTYWSDRVDVLFVICMSLLLIYLFRPRSPTTKSPEIDTEVRLLLFLYGIITLLTMNWKVFLSDSQIKKFYEKLFSTLPSQTTSEETSRRTEKVIVTSHY